MYLNRNKNTFVYVKEFFYKRRPIKASQNAENVVNHGKGIQEGLVNRLSNEQCNEIKPPKISIWFSSKFAFLLQITNKEATPLDKFCLFTFKNVV
jgi:hypothetical protein